ncbi:hypothetical protein [Alkalinema pantanalense]
MSLVHHFSFWFTMIFIVIPVVAWTLGFILPADPDTTQENQGS